MEKIIIKLFLTLIFVFFILNQIVRLPITAGIVVNPLDVVLSFTLFFYTIVRFVNKQHLKKHEKYLGIPFILFILSGLIGIIVNPWIQFTEYLPSLLYLLRWIVYFSFLVVILDFINKEYILKLMVLSGFVITILGYLQYFFYPNLRNLYYLGWDDHLYRLFSTFLDPNFAGAFLVLYCLFLFRFIKPKNKIDIKNSLFSILLILSLVAMFLTYSRTAFVMAVIGVVIYFLLQKKFKHLFIILVGLILLFFIFAGELEGLNPFRTASVIARIESSINAFVIFLYHPIFGVGFNAYRFAQLHYQFRGGEYSLTSHGDAGTDNSYLFVLATTGIVGFISYFFLWKRILSLFRYEYSKQNIILYSTLAAWGVGSLFTNLLFYPPLLLWILFVIGTTRNN